MSRLHPISSRIFILFLTVVLYISSIQTYAAQTCTDDSFSEDDVFAGLRFYTSISETENDSEKFGLKQAQFDSRILFECEILDKKCKLMIGLPSSKEDASSLYIKFLMPNNKAEDFYYIVKANLQERWKTRPIEVLLDEDLSLKDTDSQANIEEILGHENSGYFLTSWQNGDRSADLFISDTSDGAQFEITLYDKSPCNTN